MAGRTKTNTRVKRDETKYAGSAKSESEVVEGLIERALEKLNERDISVTELIKLLQVRKELDADKVKEIEVRWVESFEKGDAQSQ